MPAITLSCGVFAIDRGEFTSDINERLWEHGLRQKLSDSFAGLKRTEFESDAAFDTARLAAATKVMESLKAGTWGRQGRGGDPIESECKRLAKKWWARLGQSGQASAIAGLRGTRKGKITDEDAAKELLGRYAALPETVTAAKAALATVDVSRLLAG